MLRWILDDAVVDENVFLPGKKLHMEAYTTAPEPPESFQVYQIYSSAMRQILKYVGVPERRALSTFAAVPSAPERFFSDRPWSIPQPRGSRKSAAFNFSTDNEDRPSARIYSSRLGAAKLGLQGGAAVNDPTGRTPIGADGRAEFQTEITFARDPVLSVRVLTGTALVNHMIQNLVDDVGDVEDPDYRDIQARIRLVIGTLPHVLLDAYTPPRDWHVRLSDDVVSGDEREPVTSTLEIEAGSTGVGYFAVAYVDEQNNEIGETTDPWMIDVNASGTVSALVDPSGVPLPSLAYA